MKFEHDSQGHEVALYLYNLRCGLILTRYKNSANEYRYDVGITKMITIHHMTPEQVNYIFRFMDNCDTFEDVFFIMDKIENRIIIDVCYMF